MPLIEKTKSKIMVDFLGLILLCYIRLSNNPDDEMASSVDRQRASLEEECKVRNMKAEFFGDYHGRNSGRSTKGRKEWQKLRDRLKDPNVHGIATVSLARLHRNFVNSAELFKYLAAHDKKLIITEGALKGEHDLRTTSGKLILIIVAVLDEYYAEMIAESARESTQRRKRQGKTIGIPPFGAVRGETGHLIPTPEGAWLLPTGSFVAGLQTDENPQEGAVWRGYYDCARRILEMYATGESGYDKTSQQMNAEGWAFRSRDDGGWKPRQVTSDDVRRVVNNWPEYGGIIFEGRKKRKVTDDRVYEARPPAHRHEGIDVNNPPFDEQLAVMPLSILRKVAKVRLERSQSRGDDHGIQQRTYPYPLSKITRCAHCERLAEKHGDPSYRSSLTGKKQASGEYILRHKPGLTCGCERQSVPCRTDDGMGIEDDVSRLLSLLTVDEDALDIMRQKAREQDKTLLPEGEREIFEIQRRQEIQRRKRRVDNFKAMMQHGEKSFAEYDVVRREEEREIERLNAEKPPAEQVIVEITEAVNAMQKLSTLWNLGEPADRKKIANALFEFLVYDLDKGQITDFQLKPWAKRFMAMRVDLLDGGDDGEIQNPGDQDQGNELPPTGLRGQCVPSIEAATQRVLDLLYPIPPSQTRVKQVVTKPDRNTEIRQRYINGDTLEDLAARFHLSHQRIHQIVQRRRN